MNLSSMTVKYRAGSVEVFYDGKLDMQIGILNFPNTKACYNMCNYVDKVIVNILITSMMTPQKRISGSKKYECFKMSMYYLGIE